MNRFIKKYSGVAFLWLLAVIAAVVFLPNIGKLEAQKGQTTIPSNMQSQVADNIQKHWGHRIGNTNQVVVVYSNGDRPITSAQQKKIDQNIKHLDQNKDKYDIKAMTSVQNTPAARNQLLSKDKSTELVQLNVSKKQSVEAVNNQLKRATKLDGVNSYVTGSEILNDDMRLSMVTGIQKTEIIAAIFILIVLIIVFRSPIVPVISLLTVGVSFIISLSLVMNLVKFFGFPLSNFTQVFMVVVLFGIGTDYNILLYNQFKDNLAKGMEKTAATIAARKVAGQTIRYSGISVLIGFSALGLANFSIYRSGLAVAVAVAVLLLVLLSLNPFFMAILGSKLYWPSKNLADQAQESRLWGFLSSKSVRFAIPAIVLVLLLTLPLMLMGKGTLNYDSAVELSNGLPSKQGLNVVEKHFSKGTAEPSTVYIKTDHRLDNQVSMAEIDRITRQLKQRDDVETVASLTQPAGMSINQFYITDQLNGLNRGLSQAQQGIQRSQTTANQQGFNQAQLAAIGTSAQSIGERLQRIQQTSGQTNVSGQQILGGIQQRATSVGAPLNAAQLQVIAGTLQQLQAQQSGVTNELNGIASDTQSIGNNLQATVSQLKALQQQAEQAKQGLGQLDSGLGQASQYLTGLQNSAIGANTFYLPAQLLTDPKLKPAFDNYLSEDRKATRLVIVLKSDPSSEAAMKSANQIRNQIQQNLKGTKLDHATVAMNGQSALISDTQASASNDFFRTSVIMLIGILIALMFVTKSILQPLFIEGTLLLAYLSSLTLARLFSSLFLGQTMLTWNTPFFSFIMIIALGVDYSIFLMRRYQEVDQGDEPAVKIVAASKFIGVVVLSAAVILGGTFAALIPSGVLTLIQVAIAVIIGLLILVLILPVILPAAIKLTYSQGDSIDSAKK
ncbi:MMPL family transporter [Fructilactobacillus florum]|uniref:Membrane transport protein MMPL domain-containing protein n=2 Tax=Fructilactobacillus florum TaxID=640331 RepID=A0A0R2CW91_9LACO|nr:MMPL family transporter [Fructilactobacillus florum]KRM92313.1 hypothetical protein FC87_GL000445 [Fructilactobacillus florum DSM 22689 = JCM 16035]